MGFVHQSRDAHWVLTVWALATKEAITVAFGGSRPVPLRRLPITDLVGASYKITLWNVKPVWPWTILRGREENYPPGG